MSIIGLVATDRNWNIGKDNKLLFKIPEDMLFFKNMTTNNTVVMGGKTFESMNYKPLVDRDNIIITNHPEKYTKGYNYDNVEFLNLAEAKKRIRNSSKDNDYYIIGGSMIYNELLPICDIIYRTKYDEYYEDADTFIPPLSLLNFKYQDNIKDGKYDNKNFYIEHWINNSGDKNIYNIAFSVFDKENTSIITCDGGPLINEYEEAYDSDNITILAKYLTANYSNDYKITKREIKCKYGIYCSMELLEYSDGVKCYICGFSNKSYRLAYKNIGVYIKAFELMPDNK